MRKALNRALVLVVVGLGAVVVAPGAASAAVAFPAPAGTWECRTPAITVDRDVDGVDIPFYIETGVRRQCQTAIPAPGQASLHGVAHCYRHIATIRGFKGTSDVWAKAHMYGANGGLFWVPKADVGDVHGLPRC